MTDYPAKPDLTGHTEPVPKRIRARMGSDTVLDTRRALYVWEELPFPAYYVPADDLVPNTISLDALTTSDLPALEGMVKVRWNTVDSWYEEDEEVFVHPRDPFKRLEACARAVASRSGWTA